MALPNLPWSTSLPASQDTVGVEQPDLTPDSSPGAEDGHRVLVDHFHALRDKLQYAVETTGDASNLPAGCLKAKVSALESAPPSHASSHEPGGGDAMAVDAAAGTGSLRTLGTGATNACAGDDARLSDARTPTSHASAHEPGGGDAMAVDAAAGTGSLRTLGTGSTSACAGDDSRLSDSRPPNGAASGDLTGTYPGPTVASGAVDNTKLADMAQATVKGRADGAGTGDPTDLTQAQLTALVDDFTSVLSGAAPASGGGTTNFLRADGSWAEPPGGGGGGQTDTVTGSNGITNVGDNVDANLAPSYGSSANTVCEGNDARLSDSRPPNGAASGDLTGTYPGPTVAAGAVDNTKLSDMAQDTIKGRASGAGSGDPTDLTAAQATAILNPFTDALQGLVPASGGGTTNFLRADGSFAAPVGGAGSPLTTKGDLWGYGVADDRLPAGTDTHVLQADSAQALGVKYGLVANASLETMVQATLKGRASGAGTGSPADLTAAQATALLNAFTDALQGLVPASGGGTTNFLRADGAWAAPAGGGGGTLVDNWFFSARPAALATPDFQSSPLTQGLHLAFIHPGIMTGVRFRSLDTSSTTFRAKLWNNTTEVAVGTLATSAAGSYIVTFTTPYTITEAMLGSVFYISLYETTNGYYTRYQSDTHQPGRGIGWLAANSDSQCQNYKNGVDDAAPTLVAGTSRFAIDPVFEVDMS